MLWRGEVLKVALVQGENALFLCQRGLDVLGLDLSPVAIAEARMKAQARGLVARFVAGNALDLLSLEETFDTVIDSGLLHILSDADRARLVASLYAVLRSGGYLHLLAFNEHASWPGPRRPDSGRDPHRFRAGLGGGGDQRLPLRGGRRQWRRRGLVGLNSPPPASPAALKTQDECVYPFRFSFRATAISAK